MFAAIQVGAVSELWISGEFEKDSSVHVPAQGTKQTLSKTYIMSRIRCTKRDNRNTRVCQKRSKRVALCGGRKKKRHRLVSSRSPAKVALRGNRLVLVGEVLLLHNQCAKELDLGDVSICHGGELGPVSCGKRLQKLSSVVKQVHLLFWFGFGFVALQSLCRFIV